MGVASVNGLGGVLESILSGRGLDRGLVEDLASEMLNGGLDDIAIAAILVALRARGESADVIAGFASALRRASVKIDTSGLDPIDTAGTGGDGSHTINASTSAAITAASIGARVLKHGNRSVSSRSGSADFLESLGLTVSYGPERARCMLREAGFAFAFAPAYHPAVKRVMPVRRRLGIRTVFNLVGPLANPGLVRRQVLGVASQQLLKVMSEAALQLGFERLLVVHGEPGIDEVSVTGPTKVVEVVRGRIEEYAIVPEDLGLRTLIPVRELRVSSPEESAARFLKAARGEGRPGDAAFIAANSAAALYVAGLSRDFRDGFEASLQAMSEGRVYRFLEELRRAEGRCRSA